MANLNPHLPNDRLVLHTVHTDEGATELYWGRANDDMALDWEGSVLFHREGGFTYKLWTPEQDVPVIVHVQGARVRVSVSEDQPPVYDGERGGIVLLDSDDIPWPVPDPQRATDIALSINTVRSAEFRLTQGPRASLRGVVYDGSTGIEFDVRLDGETWYVNDDEGRDFANTQLQTALLAAIEANRD